MKTFKFNNVTYKTLADVQNAAYCTAQDIFYNTAEDRYGNQVFSDDPHCPLKLTMDEIEYYDTMLNDIVNEMFDSIVEIDDEDTDDFEYIVA